MGAIKTKHQMDDAAWMAIRRALTASQRRAWGNLHDRLYTLVVDRFDDLHVFGSGVHMSPKEERLAEWRNELWELLNTIPWME
jgi:hypothetical protein